MDRLQRRAENEALFRQVNERIARQGADAAGLLEIVCECGDGNCFEHVVIGTAAYERARSDATVFIARPGHDDLDLEEVVEDAAGYRLLRKRGDAAAIAEEQDPRA